MTPYNQSLLDGKKKCKRGHIYPASDNQCHECRRARQRKWKKDHPDKINKQRRDRYAVIKDSINVKERAWRAEHSEQGIWYGMVFRCTNEKYDRYMDYGGRGIKVCDRWIGEEGFKNFLSDMGPRPSSRHTIDRYPNNNGDYEPSNCRWALPKQQSRNMRSNAFYEFDGESLCISEWAERYGIGPQVLARRIKLGWPMEIALTQPVKKYNK